MRCRAIAEMHLRSGSTRKASTVDEGPPRPWWCHTINEHAKQPTGRHRSPPQSRVHRPHAHAGLRLHYRMIDVSSIANCGAGIRDPFRPAAQGADAPGAGRHHESTANPRFYLAAPRLSPSSPFYQRNRPSSPSFRRAGARRKKQIGRGAPDGLISTPRGGRRHGECSSAGRAPG